MNPSQITTDCLPSQIITDPVLSQNATEPLPSQTTTDPLSSLSTTDLLPSESIIDPLPSQNTTDPLLSQDTTDHLSSPLQSTNSTRLSVSLSLINIRSLRSNSLLLLSYLKYSKIKLVDITETWISPDDSDIFSLFHDIGYSLFISPRIKGRGGGVGILVHSDLPSPTIIYPSFSYSD